MTSIGIKDYQWSILICYLTEEYPSIFHKLYIQIPQSENLPVVIVRNRSWPAVSQIWSLIRFPSSSMVLILKSILHKKQWWHEYTVIFCEGEQNYLATQKFEDIPYGSDETGGEGTIWETQKEATLTNTCKINLI